MVFMRDIKQNARKDPSESGNSEEENNLYYPDTKILLVCNFHCKLFVHPEYSNAFQVLWENFSSPKGKV